MAAVAARAAQVVTHVYSSVDMAKPECTPYTLPANGIIDMGASVFVTLTTSVVFQPECTASAESSRLLTTEASANLRDPFYASTIPQVYVLSATTVLAYMLVIMLLITPRTFLSDGMVILGRRGFTNGPSGGDGTIGIGGRPWLQKGATLTVAISLTIASVDTIRVAKRQYNVGYMDATSLQSEVLNGLELLIFRTISITFLWLAQAQTLIRLFPRQREKIIIKWTAFALILFEFIFECLNNFLYRGYTRPHNFTDAIPALAYIFELALNLLYCAWVIYYALTKKKYAWYHPQMRNICIVAVFSLAAIFVPIVFFCLDMVDPDAASWGDYVRWVGAAAASVVVWEWVERIEALERNDRKDGVLGREVFDGDEMLEVTPSSDSFIRARRLHNGNGSGPDGGNSAGAVSKDWPTVAGIGNQYRSHLPQTLHQQDSAAVEGQPAPTQLPAGPPQPPLTTTPVSRTDSGSAESTIYAIRYHPIGDIAQPVVETSSSRTSRLFRGHHVVDVEALRTGDHGREDSSSTELDKQLDPEITDMTAKNGKGSSDKLVHTFGLANPFKKKSQNPPPEVSAQLPSVMGPPGPSTATNRWNLLARLEEFTSAKVERMIDGQKASQEVVPLPVTRIPAPPRRRQIVQHMANLAEETEADAPKQEDVSRTELPPIGVGGSPSSTTQDIYTASESNRARFAHRGSQSFVSSMQQPSDRHSSAAAHNLPVRDYSQPSVDSPPPISNNSHNSAARGLPVVRIPAPPRRGRNE